MTEDKLNDTSIKFRMNSPTRQIMLVLMLFVVLFTSSCNKTSTDTNKQAEETPVNKSEKTKVVTTFLPVYLFTKAVAGNVADVEILVQPGTEVHEYQATPDNVKAIATADVLVKNGLGLEEFITDTVKNAQNTKLVQIDASKGIQAITDISPTDKTVIREKDHNENHISANPHVWLDPVFAKQQVINIRDGLVNADSKNKATYENNAAVYIQELENLNNEFQQTLQKTPNCTFITFHDAFPYIAKRYKIQQVAVVEIPEDQLSPTDIQKAINAVKKYKVKALFSEPGIDNKLLTSLAKDLNLNLSPLNSLETGDTDPQYYFKAMRDNLKALSAGCK